MIERLTKAVNMINQLEKKQQRQKARFLMIVAIMLFIILIIALVVLTFVLVNYGRDELQYSKARSLAVQAAEAQPTRNPTTPAPGATPSPEPTETPPIQVDFVALREQGRNVLGWLYCADTLMNYPVVYYSNNTYYLSHDYTGTRSEGGALFFDYRLTKKLEEQNLIIYGHHMKNRSMFGNLLWYTSQDYYDAHPTIYLLTPDKNYRIDLFAAQYTDSDPEQFPVWFETEENRRSFVQTAIVNSSFQPEDATYRADAQIISLVTCAYSDYIKDAKFQVHGWLTEIG